MARTENATARVWLVQAREEKGLNQAAMAAAVGIAQPSYCDIENGKTTPKIANAVKIAEALGRKDWSWVYDGVDAEIEKRT